MALAGTTSISGNTVTYTGGTNETNLVQAGYDTTSPGGPYIVVQENNRQFGNTASGNGCTNTNPNSSTPDSDDVWCSATGITQVVLNGGDLNDSLSTGSFFYIVGGGNSDAIGFPPGISFIMSGGDGNDTITLPSSTRNPGVGVAATGNGGGGNDTINASDGQTANGDDGDDTLNSGGAQAGENPPFVGVNLNGGGGNDALNGDNSNPATPDRLHGDDGDDGLFPGTGPEDLVGGNGVDSVAFGTGAGPGTGGTVNVSADNAPNDGVTNQGANVHSDVETLFGTGGTDVLTGAPGVANFVDGLGGNDTFNTASNPADPDVIVCGDGFITINADAADVFDTVGPTGCRGRINKPPVASAVTLKIRSTSTKIDSDGEVAVKVGCRGTGNCRGVLVADKNGTVLGTAQFVVPSGKTKRVAFLPRPAYAKRLKSGKTVKATVTVDATDGGGAIGSATGTVTIHGKKHGKKHKK